MIWIVSYLPSHQSLVVSRGFSFGISGYQKSKSGFYKDLWSIDRTLLDVCIIFPFAHGVYLTKAKSQLVHIDDFEASMQDQNH
jgi:hypothetical protein